MISLDVGTKINAILTPLLLLSCYSRAGLLIEHMYSAPILLQDILIFNLIVNC